MAKHLDQVGDTRALVVLLAVVFIIIAGFGVVIPLLPFYAQSLHASPLEVSLMFSAFSLGQLFGEAFWGRLSDRIGRRPVLMITMAATGLAYLALAFAPNIWIAAAMRLAGGLASGNLSTIQGYLADVTPPERRAGRMGILGSAFSAGFIAGPAIGGLLARPELGPVGFQLPIFAAALFALLAAAGVMVFVRETRAPHHADAKPLPRLQAIGAALKNPVIGRVILMSVILVSGFAGIEATYGLWTKARFGWGPHQIGFAFMAVGCLGAATQALLTGPLARRFGEARCLLGGLAAMMVGMLTQMTSPNWPIAIAGFYVTAFGQSLTFPNIAALISRAAPAERQGEMLGLNASANGLARIGGPLYAGAAFDAVSIAAPFAIAAALFVPGIFVATQVERRVRAAA